MTGSDPQPGWRALRVGPGGVAPEDVSPLGRPGPAGPPAVLGSFDQDQRRHRGAWGWLALLAAAAVLAATLFWSAQSASDGPDVGLAPGTCLTSADAGSVVAGVACGSAIADFRVVARYDSGGPQACASVAPDLVMVAAGGPVLCLDYVARVGECLVAVPVAAADPSAPSGSVGAAGKRACADRSAGAMYRVLAVLPGALDARTCPRGTVDALLHADPAEVICLGLP